MLCPDRLFSPLEITAITAEFLQTSTFIAVCLLYLVYVVQMILLAVMDSKVDKNLRRIRYLLLASERKKLEMETREEFLAARVSGSCVFFFG